MSKPATYTGSATTSGSIADFETAFNPLKWPQTAPYLWTQTYLIAPARPAPPAAAPGAAGPLRTPPSGVSGHRGLPLVRSEFPPEAPPQNSWPDFMLYEEALFGGFLYRNVLETSFDSKPDRIDFTYKQVQCLDTVSFAPRRVFDGGIDIDEGFGRAEVSKESPGQVAVSVSKTVRFTQPRKLAGDVNMLAHVMVPLSFDFWLHCALFKPEDTKNG